ncbi:hypothetical protein BDFB_012328 [Asbolus verrucosus]|uniref:7tm 6 domain containing protein n=1 Tax=Asbolus verrucosus TaxID=1661398 RepID=A0A482VRI4_ASBVE|nr:hypothetical protein BDFB_012328 [Asbolus verrucosus]
MTFGFVRNKVIQFVLLLTTIFHGSILLIQMVDLLRTFDGNIMALYGASFFLMCNCLIWHITAYKVEKFLTHLFIEHEFSRFWTLGGNGEVIKKVIIESKKINIISVATVTILVFSSAYWAAFTDENDIFYGIMLFKKITTGKMSNFLCFMYYSSLPLLSHMGFVNGGFIIYVAVHLKFKVYVINDCLERMLLHNNNIKAETALLKNRIYQKTVFQQLKICVTYHRLIKV